MPDAVTHDSNLSSRSGKRSDQSSGHLFVDSETILRIDNLELRAKVIVEGFMAGMHRSPYHGFSVEFTDYREYSPGDDLRHLDWKLLARQDRLYIKRFEDETNLRCYLLVDLSQSMGFSTGPINKAQYAKTTAATLAYFLSLQRDAVGVITFADQIYDYLPPRYRPGHLRRLMMCLERSPQGTATDLSRPFDQIAQTTSKRGLIVLVSDLLAPADEWTQHLGFLRSIGHDIIILRILDPAEVNFEFDSAAVFQDMETEKEIYVDPDAVSGVYRERFSEHDQTIRTMCNHLGIDYFQVLTNDPFEAPLLDLIQARDGRGSQRNRGQNAGRQL